MFVKGFGYCIATICLLQLAATNAKNSTNGRVVGGQLTTIDNFPYLVQIWNNGNFICGGSLLTPKFAVSAAHCVVGVHPSQVTVVGGSTKLSEPVVSRKVDDIMRFENFDVQTMDNDVALLKFRNPMEGTNIGFIELYTEELKVGTNVQVSGWGLTSKNGVSPSNQVRTVTVPITDWAECKKDYEKIKRVTVNMFCASQSGTKDACDGDSGGPAAIDGKLAGIVSFGEGCARPQYSGVYTAIRKVKHFIEACLKS